MKSQELLQRFVQGFEESGTLCDPQPELVKRQSTDKSALDSIYCKLPARFPTLYEQLVLNYRWYSSTIGGFDLFANPPGENLDGLLAELFRDRHLSEVCLPNGFIQFGSGPDVYDPLCFDLTRSTTNKDFAIVQLDHEEILCNRRIKIKQTVSPSFEHLVLRIVSGSEEY